MKSSTFLGSAFSVLLALSAISYSKTFVQDPKAAQQAQTPNQPSSEPIGQASADAPKQPVKVTEVSAATETSKAPASLTGTATAKSAVAGNADATVPKTTATVATSSLTYTATAYSLRGLAPARKPLSRGRRAPDASAPPLC